MKTPLIYPIFAKFVIWKEKKPGYTVNLQNSNFWPFTENIALRRHAWQRYPFHGTPWNATYAVDGRRSDLAPAGGQCAISAADKSIAEWRVDLGKVRNLHHVFIQYRTDNVAWGIYRPTKWKRRVFILDYLSEDICVEHTYMYLLSLNTWDTELGCLIYSSTKYCNWNVT